MPDKNTNKLCVFCGSLPDEKTKEHILPRWLLELTGDANRKGLFGAQVTRDGQPPRQREFALSSFKFPACRTCNDEFGKLESRAKVIVLKVLANEALDNDELTDLLDWFDKVRIGLWLAFNRLDEFSDVVEPAVHIKLGQTLKDRLLFVYEYEDPARDILTFYGANAPVFYLMPNAFILTVKDKLFLNAAADFLVAEKLGFPYGEFVALQENPPDPVYRLRPGTGVAAYPVLRLPTAPGGTEIYQMVSSVHNFPGANDALRDVLLDDEYATRTGLRDYAGDGQVRVSQIFYKKPANALALLGENEKLCLRPPARLPLTGIGDVIASLFLEFQLGIWLDHMPSSLAMMTPQQRRVLPAAINSTLNNQVDFFRAAVAGKS